MNTSHEKAFGSNSSRMNHRKRNRADNPLSAARGQKGADSLWHRKSGAGFRLFVEFYSGQPEAVCRPSSRIDAGLQQDRKASLSKGTSLNPGAGLSRASKRRKKKSGKIAPNTKKNQGESPLAASANTPQRSSSSSHRSPASSELLSALKSISPAPELGHYEESFRQFLSTLSDPLPITFRIRRGLEDSVRQRIQKEIASFDSLVAQSSIGPSIYQARSCTLSKETIAKQAPELRTFLIGESGQGSLARQELGSMLPVLALSESKSIRQGSRVLDMCASPGSKTLQALELVGAKGRITANDINENRLTALKDAVDRSGVRHTDRIRYTLYDASEFPVPEKRWFDAVICDVPCSGDGTVRKDRHILPAWTPNTSNTLHSLQVGILKRAIDCVKVGGVVSYSTCSLNPVEDEAVVCAVLKQFGDRNASGPTVELLNCPLNESFCARPGVKNWFVADYDGSNVPVDDDDDDGPRLRWHDSFQSAVQADMPSVCETMWPPDETPDGLEKCVRLHPQDHDSGGFFVALIKRLK